MDWDKWWPVLEGGVELENRVVDTWRWGSVHERVFMEDGKIFGVTYFTQPEHGMECGMNPDEPEIYEMIAREKTVIEYVVKSDE